ncbi:unnamed protein product [Parascedosporium putredinis]|uniref:DUF7801 domain-containing protein n=1 Tax=Parascedosporium putredinis TaxID=1442378 RepID=A0A9P1GWQ2_9PEZI|nr:unnamed protein product [Parascedosporium putredinis]CAI7989065.1 unnamed protein product [Parascedosporium putredinis]
MAAEFKQKELDGKQREIKEKNDVLDSLNMMVVELKTELTIAQAELDGAYGSRAERAADVAAIKSNDQVNELHTQIDTLKTELDQTLKQLEDITRETITAEREKLEIEGRLDDTIAARATLEAEIEELRQRLDAEVLGSREKINKLQEELDTQRLKAVPTGEGGASRPGAGASMLSEQFRATMREERKKFQEDLRRLLFRRCRSSRLGGGATRHAACCRATLSVRGSVACRAATCATRLAALGLGSGGFLDDVVLGLFENLARALNLVLLLKHLLDLAKEGRVAAKGKGEVFGLDFWRPAWWAARLASKATPWMKSTGG